MSNMMLLAKLMIYQFEFIDNDELCFVLASSQLTKHDSDKAESLNARILSVSDFLSLRASFHFKATSNYSVPACSFSRISGSIMEIPKPSQRKKFTQRPQPRHPQSTKNAFVVILGPSNTGKSSTLNNLFGNRQISDISSQEGTSRLVEYSTNLRSERNVKILDVPGLGNPHNLTWDAKVLATLKKYLDTDPELKECIPNVVLIVARFDDPKLTNKDGPFVRSLTAINLLNARLFDKQSCNAIILLTHYSTGKKAHKSHAKLRQKEVMDLVKDHTKFPQMPYILYGDNHGMQLDLESVHDPLYGHGCYRLGDDENTIYPSNLIDLIIKISAGSTKGALGPDFFNKVFQSRESIFLWKSCNLPLISSDRKRFRRAFYSIKESYKSIEHERIYENVE